MPERDVSHATETCRIVSDDSAYRPYCVTHDRFIRRCSVAIEHEAAAIERRKVVEQVPQFWKAAGEWTKAGSGMTREQETGAAMVWSWLQARLDELSPPSSDRGASR